MNKTNILIHNQVKRPQTIFSLLSDASMIIDDVKYIKNVLSSNSYIVVYTNSTCIKTNYLSIKIIGSALYLQSHILMHIGLLVGKLFPKYTLKPLLYFIARDMKDVQFIRSDNMYGTLQSGVHKSIESNDSTVFSNIPSVECNELYRYNPDLYIPNQQSNDKFVGHKIIRVQAHSNVNILHISRCFDESTSVYDIVHSVNNAVIFDCNVSSPIYMIFTGFSKEVYDKLSNVFLRIFLGKNNTLICKWSMCIVENIICRVDSDVDFDCTITHRRWSADYRYNDTSIYRGEYDCPFPKKQARMESVHKIDDNENPENLLSQKKTRKKVTFKNAASIPLLQDDELHEYITIDL
jgi:hypothetical protein